MSLISGETEAQRPWLGQAPTLGRREPGFRPDRFASKGQILSAASDNTFPVSLSHLDSSWARFLPGRGSRLLEGRMVEQAKHGIFLQRPTSSSTGEEGGK